jgi:photosystem II stability/assembly factor-like uncharacterized protein
MIDRGRIRTSILAVMLLSNASIACARQPLAWNSVGRGLRTHVPVIALAVDPHDPNRIYAGAYGTPGLYLSIDQARTWRTHTDGIGSVPVLSLEYLGNDLFAGTTSGLYRQRDNLWARVEPIPSVAIYSIARGYEGESYLAADRRGIFASPDDGSSWQRIPGLDDEIVLSVAAPDAQTILAGTGGHGAFITRDRGESWSALDLFTGDYVSLIQIDPRNHKTIFLRTRWGLFRTRNLGVTWEIIQGGIEASVVNALLVSPSRLIAATSAGVLVSDDDGASWREKNTRLPGGSQPLALAQIDEQTILVGAQTGIYITRCGRKLASCKSRAGCRDRAFARVDGFGALIAATEDGLYENDDGAFRFVGNDTMRIPALAVAIAPNDPRRIYAGSYRRGIFVSGDAGKSWSAAGDIFNGRLAAPGLAINPVDDQVLFARVLFQRIYKSDDGGESWRAVWTGMSDDTEVETMAIAPSDPAIMFAGTNFGIFMSRNGGESWTPSGLSDNSSRWASFRNVFAIWIDPRDHAASLPRDGRFVREQRYGRKLGARWHGRILGHRNRARCTWKIFRRHEIWRRLVEPRRKIMGTIWRRAG